MCGIVGYIGKRNTTIGDLLLNAYYNDYRGDDGMGILYKTKTGEIVTEKMLYSLEEVNTEKLDKDRAIKNTRIGSFLMKTPDKELYSKLQDDFAKKMKTLHKTSTNLAFIHHRKATYGGNEERNLHPIECSGNYYLHNGTATGVESIKKYLELFNGNVFASETDTEVIATLFNLLKDRHGNNYKKVYTEFSDMFGRFTWGVLIEITPEGKITIIKDDSRNLWLYKNRNGMILVSEPTPYVTDFNHLSLLPGGYYKLKPSTEGVDYTSNGKKVLEWWTDSLMVDTKVKYYTECDVCKSKKGVLSSIYGDDDYLNTSSTKLMCMECMILNEASSSNDSKEDKMLIKKQVYSNYLG